VPQFRGDYGKIRFNTEDLSWTRGGQGPDPLAVHPRDQARPGGVARLDIIHVVNGRITEKLTYAKAKVPLLGDIA